MQKCSCNFRLLTIAGAVLLFICSFSVTTFSQTFNMVGTTATAGSGYDLTPTTGGGCNNQYGALWSTTTVDFSRPFQLDFQAKFNPPATGTGADGLCVVFGQMGDTAAPAGVGGGLGYYASPSPFTSHSFAIELDIFNNGPTADDIADDHTTITENAIIGTPMPGASPVAVNGASGIKDNVFRNYRVVWSPATRTLLFYCNCRLLITSHYNYAGIFSTPTTVNWGFTASTGGDCAQQFVQNISISIPTVPVIDTALCGSSLTLTDTASGPQYYWSPSTATTSSVTVTTSGTYSVISYDTASCRTSTETFHVTLNPIPAISGPSTVCSGQTITLSDTVSGSTWSSGNPAVASVGSASGVVTGISAGTATITCTSPAGCTATKTITVNIGASVSGPSAVCTGDSITLTGSPTGGTWVSSFPLWATVGASTGVVHGLIDGVVNITYTLPDGCSSIHVVSVNPTPGISGTLSLCVGGSDTINAITGTYVTWSSSNTSIATVTPVIFGPGSPYARLTGIAAGTVTITDTNTGGCYTTAIVTVNPDPAITGTLTVCVGLTTTLSAMPPGGTWSSDATAVASVGSSTGIVTGNAAGTAHIRYTVPGAGCFAIKTVTVNPVPIPFRLTTPICVGTVVGATSSPSGGTWTSSNTAVATYPFD